jgi:membrane-associated HD superfamily phosphohydrolase
MWDRELRQSLQRIERKLDVIMRAMALEYEHERRYEMATAETLARLQTDLAANTDATQATKTALEHYAQANAELTKQLQDAIAASADDEVLKGIADQMEANTKSLLDAAPTAKAVTDNTAAATA